MPETETREYWLSLVNGLDPRPSGGWVRFHCPVPGHGKGQGDRDRSAGVGQKPPFVKCFGQCSLKDLAEALRGRNGHRPMPRSSGPVSKESGKKLDENAWIEVESYEYRNAQGTLIAVKRRREQPDPASESGYSKDFSWRLPEAKTYDGFHGKLTMTDIPLWGAELLPPLGLDQRVWFTEGEKACKALRAQGEIAVCAGGGGGQTEFGESLEPLTGRLVIIWPDNDKVGRDYARMVRRALKGIARQTVTVSAPVGPKEDAHEYFYKYKGTVEALLEGKLTEPTTDILGYDHFKVRMPVEGGVVGFEFREVHTRGTALNADMTVTVQGPGYETEPYNQEINLKSQSTREGLKRLLEGQFGGGKDSPLNWTTLISTAYARLNRAFEETDHMVQLMDLPAPPALHFVVGTFVPTEAPTLVFGRGGSLKSWIIAWWALHLAMGVDLPGGYAVPRAMNIAILDYEDPASWQERFRRLLLGMDTGLDPDMALAHLPIKFWKGDRGMSLESIKAPLKRSIRRHEIDVFIVDSAMPACGGKPEDSDTSIAFWNTIHSLDVTSIIISHVSAAEMENGMKRPYGNVLWENQPRRIWAIHRDDDEDTDEIDVMARCTKVNRGKKPPPQGLRFHFDGEEGAVWVEPVTDIRSKEAFAKNFGLPDQIRAVLLREKRAMTLAELADALSLNHTQQGRIRMAAKRMPDVGEFGGGKGRGAKKSYGLLAPGQKKPEQGGLNMDPDVFEGGEEPDDA